MFHDQGLSPVKTLDFFNSVNVTGGLPILRVSPDMDLPLILQQKFSKN